MQSNGTVTIDGKDYTSTQMCYIEEDPDSDVNNYQAFLSQCKDALGDDKAAWILVSNYENNKDRNLEVLKWASNFDESHV
mmetsp:Transcript_42349/g.64982  ORF Transcript_42349/g.64982 Transcript_42349/m.64982 type:complete len:80 (+) Transcript_42349:191-430(+)